MVEVVVKLGLKREPGYLYLVGDGKLYGTKMVPAGERRDAPKRELGPEDVVVDLGITQDPEYDYFIDHNGDISRTCRQGAKHGPGSSVQGMVDGLGLSLAIIRWADSETTIDVRWYAEPPDGVSPGGSVVCESIALAKQRDDEKAADERSKAKKAQDEAAQHL